MSRKTQRRAGSLTYQVNGLFAQAHAVGQSKHAAKRAGASEWQGRVFALRTDWAYRDATLAFVRWARAQHGCHLVAEAVQRPEWGAAWDAELATDGKSAATRKTYLSGVAKACAIVAPALREQWTQVIAGVDHRTPPPPRGYGERAEELIAAVGDASLEAGLVLQVILETGARIGEVVPTQRTGDHHLTPERLRGDGQVLLTGKGGLVRVQTISPATYARLLERATGTAEGQSLFALTDRDVQRELRAACGRLGLRAAGPHGLRYDFATRLRARLLAAGWRELAADREVSRQLGHRRPEITHHYLRVA